MKYENIDNLFLKRIDKSFNYILGIASLIAFSGGTILLISNLMVYGLINIFSGFVLLTFFCFASKIHTRYKIILLIIVTLIIGFASYYGGSFTSLLLIILIVSNILSVGVPVIELENLLMT